MKRLLPSRWRLRIKIVWGIVLACHASAVVNNEEELYTFRFLLALVRSSSLVRIVLMKWRCGFCNSVRTAYLAIYRRLKQYCGALSSH
jgi:hypothetical protein